MIFKQGLNVTFVKWFFVYKELSYTVWPDSYTNLKRKVLTPFYDLKIWGSEVLGVLLEMKEWTQIYLLLFH